MKTIGIKLADGTFYPILEEGEPTSRTLDVTTVKDNQTKVQIDLYRSESGTMEDAEYVDTLEVTNLNPHPNGEPSLHLSVNLDEQNELTAHVVDDETGKSSDIQVHLVSRTLAERENTDADFALPETAIADAELAALEHQARDEEAAAELPADPTLEDFSFDDLTDDQLAENESKKAAADSALAEADLATTSADAADDFSLDDISLDLPSFDDLDASLQKSPGTDDTATDTPTPAEESAATDFGTESASLTDDDFSLDLDDVDTNLTLPKADDTALDLPDFGDLDNLDAPAPDKAMPAETAADVAETADTFDTAALDLPDFDFDLGAQTTTPSADSPANTDTAEDTTADDLPTFSSSDFDLPDFGDDTTTSDSETAGISGLFDDPIFDTDDFGTKSATATPGSAMDFSDLYDKETLAGEHSTPYDDDEEETVRKTRVPVIICVVCAIICIIATLLILFVIPSKYNLIKSRNTKHTAKESSGWVKPLDEIPLDVRPVEQTPAESKPAPVPVTPAPKAPEPPAPQPTAPAVPAPSPIEIEKPDLNVPNVVVTDAQEDKIIVAPEPAKIVPVPTEKPKIKKDVRYRIKWGDTLWDISEAYYKNPWKYPKIARYNNIKNPDLIISGTDILIPEE